MHIFPALRSELKLLHYFTDNDLKGLEGRRSNKGRTMQTRGPVPMKILFRLR